MNSVDSKLGVSEIVSRKGSWSSVYFDFDGTIANTAIDKKNAFYALVAACHTNVVGDVLRRLDGRHREEIFLEISRLTREALAPMESNFEISVRGIYQNAECFTDFTRLKRFFDCPFYILTSGRIDGVRDFLVSRGLAHFFADIVRPAYKRDYFEARALELQDEKLLFFGDGPQDYACNTLSNVTYVHCEQWSDFVPDGSKCIKIKGLDDLAHSIQEHLDAIRK